MRNPQQLARRPLAVKIDNAPSARPQSGLSEAAVVYEHLTEGGITRFTAIFMENDPDPVGPIRSARMVDLDIPLQYNAIFVHFGGGPTVMARLPYSGVHDLDCYYIDDLCYRSKDRPAPHNAYSSADFLRNYVKDWNHEVPLGRFFFAEALPVPTPTVTYIAIPFSDVSYAEYRYRYWSGTYLRYTAREPHIDANTGRQLEVKNIVVQYVKTQYLDVIEDAGGSRSLVMDLMGTGRADIFSGGQVIHGRWLRTEKNELTRFVDEAGNLVAFVPGNIWIALVPTDFEIVAR